MNLLIEQLLSAWKRLPVDVGSLFLFRQLMRQLYNMLFRVSECANRVWWNCPLNADLTAVRSQMVQRFVFSADWSIVASLVTNPASPNPARLCRHTGTLNPQRDFHWSLIDAQTIILVGFIDTVRLATFCDELDWAIRSFGNTSSRGMEFSLLFIVLFFHYILSLT